MCAKAAHKRSVGIFQYNMNYLAMLLALSQGLFSCKHARDAHFPFGLSGYEAKFNLTNPMSFFLRLDKDTSLMHVLFLLLCTPSGLARAYFPRYADSVGLLAMQSPSARHLIQGIACRTRWHQYSTFSWAIHEPWKCFKFQVCWSPKICRLWHMGQTVSTSLRVCSIWYLLSDDDQIHRFLTSWSFSIVPLAFEKHYLLSVA